MGESEMLHLRQQPPVLLPAGWDGNATIWRPETEFLDWLGERRAQLEIAYDRLQAGTISTAGPGSQLTISVKLTHKNPDMTNPIAGKSCRGCSLNYSSYSNRWVCPTKSVLYLSIKSTYGKHPLDRFHIHLHSEDCILSATELWRVHQGRERLHQVPPEVTPTFCLMSSEPLILIIQTSRKGQSLSRLSWITCLKTN